MLSGKVMEMVGQWSGRARGENACVMTTKQSLFIRSQRLHFNLNSPIHPSIHPPTHSFIHPSTNYVPGTVLGSES